MYTNKRRIINTHMKTSNVSTKIVTLIELSIIDS